MDRKKYKSFDELPLFLDAKILGELLGLSRTSVYELIHEQGFPYIRLGKKIVVPRDKFISWIETHTEK